MRISDWSSDVCSSDLIAHRATRHLPALQALAKGRSDFVSPRMKARLMATSDTVSFGYEQVPAGAKTAMVGAVFSRVARKYDIMNDAMSGGMHRLWKDRFVRRVKPPQGEQNINRAGGTGTLPFRKASFGAR